MAARTGPRGRGRLRRQSDVGQMQDRGSLLPEGFEASASIVGRILAALVKRGAVTSLPRPGRRPAAYDPVAKWTRVAGRGSAASAKAMLDKLIAEAPFPVRGH